MATVTKPILLDETGVAIKESLDTIADNMESQIAEAPNDGTEYVRKNKTWTPAVSLADLKPQTKTTWESGNTPLDNTIYRLGTLASLTIAAAPTDNTLGVAIYFTSGASATTLSYPVGSKWTQAVAPTIAANTDYMLTILDGVFNIITLSTLS